MPASNALARFPTDPYSFQASPAFILPCQPALADRPPSGPGWLHEIKFDGYRVIARKDGNRVRLWGPGRSQGGKTPPRRTGRTGVAEDRGPEGGTNKQHSYRSSYFTPAAVI